MKQRHDPHKKTLLIVYNFNRYDFLTYFYACKKHFNFFFAEFVSPQEVHNLKYQEFGQAVYWKDFKDAFDLLEKVKPDKVLFLYIESYFHMALNIACKVKGVPTYLLDHGVQDLHVHRLLAAYTDTTPKKTAVKRLLIKLSQFTARVKARLFITRTQAALPPSAAVAFEQYYLLRKKENYLTVVKKLNAPIYRADTYLAISPKVAAGYTILLNYKPEKIFYFGIPTYDRLATLPISRIQRKAIIFIDQGLATAGFLGWTPADHLKFIDNFTAICATHGFKVYVKKHPRQPFSDWTNLKHQNLVKIIDDIELALLLPETPVIVGFFSTYLLPLIAFRHTTLITFENHPIGKLDVSKSFIDAGVAHPVYEMHELHKALDNIEQLHQQQLPNKAKFTEDWLYKFDGKSGERLRDILLNE